MVQRAKENLALSGLADRSVRFIVDDVIKFVQREKRRGRQYDAVIMILLHMEEDPGGSVEDRG